MIQCGKERYCRGSNVPPKSVRYGVATVAMDMFRVVSKRALSTQSQAVPSSHIIQTMTKVWSFHFAHTQIIIRNEVCNRKGN